MEEKKELMYRIGERRMSDGTSEYFVEKWMEVLGIWMWIVRGPDYGSKEACLRFIHEDRTRPVEVGVVYHEVQEP